jgi:hypothetical protein
MAQVLSAAVVAYIKEMGVVTELFTISTCAGKDEAITFSEPHSQGICWIYLDGSGCDRRARPRNLWSEGWQHGLRSPFLDSEQRV